MRVALYYAPRPDDLLHHAGAAWLGRDPESGATVAQPAVPGLSTAALHDATAAPRRYGLHATLSAPRHLATGWEDFVAAAAAVATRTPCFDLPPLHLADLDGFLALCAPACPALDALAEACVRGVDVHHLRPDEDELRSRRAVGLDAEQDALLRRWGYPHVLSRWQFHITLSGRVTPKIMQNLQAAARTHFGKALRRTRRVDEICIVTESAPGLPMLIGERLALRG